MKIALIHTQYGRKGGTESYLLDLIKGFREVGDEVDLYIYKRDSNLPVPDGCRLIQKKRSWTPRLLRDFRFASWTQKAVNRSLYDCVITLARTEINHISVCGGNHPGYLRHMGKSTRLRDRKYINLEKKCFQSSQYVIAHSAMMRDEIIHYYDLKEENVKVIYPPSDPSRFHCGLRKQRQAFADTHHIDLSKMNFLFPSTGHKRKGFFELLEAFKMLPVSGCELFIVGDKPEIPLPPNVHFLGFVNDIEKLYTAVNFTILPSKYEPFGLVVSESLACGTPVIVSTYTGAAELMTKSDGIILKDVSVSTIIDTLMDLQSRHFQIEPGFLQRNGLTIENHISQVKLLISKLKYNKDS